MSTSDTTSVPGMAGSYPELPDGWGWYLYGITRRGWTPPPGPPAPGTGDEAVHVLESNSVAAVVRPVHLSEFEENVLQAGSSDPVRLAAIAHTHNEVIASVHRDQAVLPAKFGAIYARADALLDALARHQMAILDQLGRLEGCDEFAVHVYAEARTVQLRVTEADEAIRRLRHDIATSSPGHAYFLERKLGDALAVARSRAVQEIGQEAYDRLAAMARDGQVRAPAGPEEGSDGETEVLRAAFLVARAETDRFLDELASLAAHREGLRAAHTGPWPPYSFAVMGEEELR